MGLTCSSNGTGIECTKHLGGKSSIAATWKTKMEVRGRRKWLTSCPLRGTVISGAEPSGSTSKVSQSVRENNRMANARYILL
jgi:hypothetical protein